MATVSRYWELRVAVTEEIAEGVTNFLWELGALGVVEEVQAPGVPTLRAYFSALVPDALDASVREYMRGLESLGFTVVGHPVVAPLADGNWASAWREHFRPLAVGASLVV